MSEQMPGGKNVGLERVVGRRTPRPKKELKVGKHLLATIKGHESRRACPTCKQDLSRTALVEIAYTFEPCRCGVVPYVHLVETLYHRVCLTPNAEIHGRRSRPVEPLVGRQQTEDEA